MSKSRAPISSFNTGTALVLPEAGDDAAIKHLRRPALLFSNIAVFHLSGITSLLEKAGSEGDLRLKAELDWLVNERIVAPFDAEFFVDHFQVAAEHFPDIIPDAIEYASAMSWAQVGWLNLAEWIGTDGVLVCARTPRLLQPEIDPGSSATGTTVLNIIFDSFPEPDENTPWEQIVEFRSDPDTAGQVLALRRWMSKIAQQSFSTAEISQEIEWLIREYQAHMRLHRMKITTGAFETIVTAAGEALENVAKLKFGALAKSVFSLRHRRIQLIEAERQAPGRELAYVVRARETFG